MTVVIAESLLLLGSCVEEVTVTELVITAPFGVGQFTVATSVMVSDAPAGSELNVTVRLLAEPPHTPLPGDASGASAVVSTTKLTAGADVAAPRSPAMNARRQKRRGREQREHGPLLCAGYTGTSRKSLLPTARARQEKSARRAHLARAELSRLRGDAAAYRESVAGPSGRRSAHTENRDLA